MTKWSDKFCEDYGTTKRVKEIKKELQKAVYHKHIENKLSEVIAGKWKRTR